MSAGTPARGRPGTAHERAGILLADDMEDNLTALEAVLAPLNQPIVRARSGQEAMRALLGQRFAVVLLDVGMPGMDGFETAAGIRRLDRAGDVPIIFLTGADDSRYAFRGYATGAADFLAKPFDPWVLRAKVEVFLELHRLRAQVRELRRLVEAARADGGRADVARADGGRADVARADGGRADVARADCTPADGGRAHGGPES